MLACGAKSVTYAVKTLLIGMAWLAVLDLPERAMTMARQT